MKHRKKNKFLNILNFSFFTLCRIYCRARYFMFIRYAAFHLQQLSAKRQRETNEQKSIEANKEEKEAATKTDKREKSQEKEKDKKQKKEEKKEKESAKKEEVRKEEEDKVKGDKTKDEELLLNENYSEIDTDVAKKIVESITDSICSGDKQESDCKYP